MIEVKSNALFLSTFSIKIDVKNERKRVSRMCENAYLSIKNPKASRAQIARFACATPLCYAGNFWPQKLGPPLDQILDLHLLLDKVMSHNQWHWSIILCLKVTEELHTRPYMVTKRRCVWTKHFHWIISCFIS